MDSNHNVTCQGIYLYAFMQISALNVHAMNSTNTDIKTLGFLSCGCKTIRQVTIHAHFFTHIIYS